MKKHIGQYTIDTKRYVDFRTIRYKADWFILCRYLGIQLKQVSDTQARAKSPFMPGANDTCLSLCIGDKNKGLFNDFKAGIRGNIIQFAKMMIPELENDHEAALFLEQLCGIQGIEFELDKTSKTNGSMPDINFNKPLGFELKNLNPAHEFITKIKNIPVSLAKYFQIGYCTKGIMKNRIAIPIHDINGELVGYCGRATSKEQVSREGKYKFPYGFKKSLEVYNLYRCLETPVLKAMEEKGLILVEGVFDVIQLAKAGIMNAVAFLGTSISEVQLEKLKAVCDKFFIFTDNDEAGKKFAHTLELLFKDKKLTSFKYGSKYQFKKSPEDFTVEELRQIFQ